MAGSEPRVPILMYHKIAPINKQSKVRGHYVSPGLFARQMTLLSLLGFQTVDLDSLYESNQKLPRKPIVITFDDGYQNFADNAQPVLSSHKFESTVFLVSNQVGGTNRWDVQMGDVEEPLMDLATIQRCRTLGTQFGSHTSDHADLSAVSAEVAWDQIRGSKESLESQLGIPIKTFCYPYGRMGSDTPKLVADAGYRLACSTLKGTNSSDTDRYTLRRINVRSDTWSAILLMKLLRSARNEG